MLNWCRWKTRSTWTLPVVKSANESKQRKNEWHWTKGIYVHQWEHWLAGNYFFALVCLSLQPLTTGNGTVQWRHMCVHTVKIVMKLIFWLLQMQLTLMPLEYAMSLKLGQARLNYTFVNLSITQDSSFSNLKTRSRYLGCWRSAW